MDRNLIEEVFRERPCIEATVKFVCGFMCNYCETFKVEESAGEMYIFGVQVFLCRECREFLTEFVNDSPMRRIP